MRTKGSSAYAWRYARHSSFSVMGSFRNAWHVARTPRTASTAWHDSATVNPVSCSISAVWRWPSGA
jgi:hypothetical protein